MKKTVNGLLLAVISLLLTVIMLGTGFFFSQLNEKIDAQTKVTTLQSEKITALDKKLTVIVTILNTKMPNANWSALMTMSAEKNISQDQLEKLILMLEKDPTQAKTYLENQLHLDVDEVDYILKPISTPNKNQAKNSSLKN